LRHRHGQQRHGVADGHDIERDYRAARSKIGLVPQELTTDAFETVWATVNFSRGLFGRAPNPAFIEKLLRDLSLSDKRNSKDHDAVRRHEAARHDRQGPVARARDTVPG
jgi:ABC-type multidrug transport system ATPase subunit